MSASYPGAAKTFATRNAGDVIQPAHINDLQDEVAAIEAGILNGTAPLNSSNSTVANLSVTGGSTFAAVNFAGAVSFSTIVNSSAQPRCALHHSVAQSITNNTETAILFDTDDIDVGNLHDSTSNTSRITIPSGADGLYYVFGTFCPISAASGNGYCYVKKNGATAIGSASRTNLINGGTAAITCQTMANLVGADYVELIGFQNSGGALNAGDSTLRAFQNQFAAVKLW